MMFADDLRGRRRAVSRMFVAAALVLGAQALLAQAALAQGASPEQVATGSRTYARNCSPCHGARMRDPEGAFDLRKFPRDAKQRFATSVLNGKGQMPPWNGMLSAEEVDAIWAYVLEGEK